MTDDLPVEHLSPLATLVDEILADIGFERVTTTTLSTTSPEYAVSSIPHPRHSACFLCRKVSVPSF